MVRLNEFGKAVRKARLDAEVTLAEMAQSLEVSPAYLSGMECGRKKVSPTWVTRIEKFFESRGVRVARLSQLADVANESVDIGGLGARQQMLVAGFARANLSPEELETFRELLDRFEST